MTPQYKTMIIARAKNRKYDEKQTQDQEDISQFCFRKCPLITCNTELMKLIKVR